MSAAAELSPQGAALAYARAGWPVFPCRPGSKEPATRNGFHDASTDERQIREWWRRAPDRNVAIATGAPGPDVVDVDKYRDGSGFAAFNQLKRAGLVPDPLAVVRTPSGGFHAYYRGTEQRNGHLAAEHVDFRSQGGYVVAPPSRVGDRQYEVIKHQPGEAVFDWDAARRELQPEPQRQPPRRPERDRDRPARVTHLADWVARQEEGNRNAGAFWAACRAVEAGDSEALDAIARAARAAGLDEREVCRTIRSAQQQRPFEREAGS